MNSTRTISGGLSEAGSTYRQMAMTWRRVFSLPPRLAAITPRRITQNRSAVTPSSPNMITPVTHQGRSPRAGRQIRGAQRLARHRVAVLAEVGPQPAAAGHPPVQHVGQRRDAERGQGGQPPAGAAGQQEGDKHRDQDDPDPGEHVGNVPEPDLGGHRRPGTTTSAVRSTPSEPVTTARTMSPGASGRVVRTVVTPSTSGA